MGAKKERAFKLTREKKKKLKVLILRKAQEDLEKEAKRKEEERVNAINELVPPLNIDDYDEEDLIGKLTQLYTWIYETEEKRLALEYQLIQQDSEMNDLTVARNEASGKFVKPQLKRVNKTQAKFKKSSGESDSAKAAAFRSGLKTSGAGPDSKFTLDDKDEKEKPEFLKEKKGKGTDVSATQSAAEPVSGAE